MIFNKKITNYFQNKNKWQIAPNLHKNLKNVTLQETMRMIFLIVVVVVDVVVDVVVAVVAVAVAVAVVVVKVVFFEDFGFWKINEF